MSKEVIFATWCDFCEADDKKEQGTSYTVHDTSGTPLEVDLCTMCRTRPFDAVLDLAVTLDRRPEPKTSTGSPSGPAKKRVKVKSTNVYAPSTDGRKTQEGSPYLACPVPGCTESRATPGRVDRHLRFDHERDPQEFQ